MSTLPIYNALPYSLYSKFSQPENVKKPSSVTLFGIVIFVNAVQSLNAFSPILVTPSGIVAVVMSFCAVSRVFISFVYVHPSAVTVSLSFTHTAVCNVGTRGNVAGSAGSQPLKRLSVFVGTVALITASPYLPVILLSPFPPYRFNVSVIFFLS